MLLPVWIKVSYVDYIEEDYGVDKGKLVKYSIELSMLKQLFLKKKITESEYNKIERQLKKDYGVISDISA